MKSQDTKVNLQLQRKMRKREWGQLQEKPPPSHPNVWKTDQDKQPDPQTESILLDFRFVQLFTKDPKAFLLVRAFPSSVPLYFYRKLHRLQRLLHTTVHRPQLT